MAGAAHVESYWAATAGPELADTGAIERDQDVDVAIIGGGYTGLSTAYHLAKDHGVRAHVLDAQRIGWGCSGRNGGFASVGVGKSDQAGWIRRWGLDEARRIFEQSREAVRLVRRLIGEEAIDAEATAEGGLELAHRENRLGELAASQRFLADRFGFATELLGRADLESRYLRSREAYGALLYSEGFALHALKYARGLASAAQRHGAVLHGASPVIGWTRDGNRHLLQTPGGVVRAREVVIASNGYTADSLHPGVAGRLMPVLSNIIVTRPMTAEERAGAAWQTQLKIWDTRHLLFYYRQLADGRILFGARGGIQDTAASRAERRAWLAARLGQMFPGLCGIETDYFWSGWVCVTRDLTPHVNTIEDGTVHYALGYMGTGVALGTLCGRLLAGRLAGAEAAEAPSALLASPLPRFPFPALRRAYQRAMYAWYELADRM